MLVTLWGLSLKEKKNRIINESLLLSQNLADSASFRFSHICFIYCGWF